MMRPPTGTMTAWALLAVLLALHAGIARALEPRLPLLYVKFIFFPHG